MGMMGIDTNIRFRFVTRTLTEDYRVFADDGERDDLSELTEFLPLRAVASPDDPEGAHAALWHDGELICLVALGLNAGAVDVQGRAISFSFAAIFGESEREQAQSAFYRVVNEWSAVEEKAASLRHEVRKEGGLGHGEDVRFESGRFLDWLCGQCADAAETAETLPHAENRYPRQTRLRVPDNGLLRWIAPDGADVICVKNGGEWPSRLKELWQKKNVRRAVAAVAAAAALYGLHSDWQEHDENVAERASAHNDTVSSKENKAQKQKQERDKNVTGRAPAHNDMVISQDNEAEKGNSRYPQK